MYYVKVSLLLLLLPLLVALLLLVAFVNTFNGWEHALSFGFWSFVVAILPILGVEAVNLKIKNIVISDKLPKKKLLILNINIKYSVLHNLYL